MEQCLSRIHILGLGTDSTVTVLVIEVSCRQVLNVGAIDVAGGRGGRPVGFLPRTTAIAELGVVTIESDET